MQSVTSMRVKWIHCHGLPVKGIQRSMLPFDWIVWLSPVTLTRVGLKLVSSQMIFPYSFYVDVFAVNNFAQERFLFTNSVLKCAAWNRPLCIAGLGEEYPKEL